MKYIFFVTTIGSIYDAILPLIEEKKDKGEILVVVATDEAEKFFLEFTDLNVIRIKANPNLITRRNKYKILMNVFLSKLEYRKLFKNIEGAEIYFCGYRYSIVVFSYVKGLMKKNKVFNCGGLPKDRFDKYPVERSFRSFVMRWIAKWLLGVETVVCRDKNLPIWVLDEIFFKEIEVKKDFDNRDKIIKKYMPKLKILDGKSILVMIVDLLESAGNYADSDSYKKFPAEFLMSHKWKYIIGIVSSSLVYAAKHTEIVVISFMDLFKWNSKADREKTIWRKEMEDVGILFPKDINELKDLLLKK